jgi:hypothetical protein
VIPIISYEFLEIKTIYKTFLKFIPEIEKDFIKDTADVSMTSATLG